MPEPDTSRRSLWLLLTLVALTAMLGASVPLAPVHTEQPVVTWPQAGHPAVSTVLPLTPYRPLSLQATVGCATVRSLNGAGDALRTMPPGTMPPETTPPDTERSVTQGLRVAADQGQVVITASGHTILVEPLPAGDCRYQVVADAAGVRVLRDSTPVAQRPDLLPPQVAELATDARAPMKLAVTLWPDDRYAAHPTALKIGLLVAHLLALAAMLAVALWIWPGRRPANRPGVVVPRPCGADAVVVAVSAAWAVLAGVNWDDSWYLLMARNAGTSGYLGNYVSLFNTAENPFVASQYLMQGWGSLVGSLGGNWGLLWMRLLPLAYGLGTWVLLRILMATALGRIGGLPRVLWLLLIAHLLWWLPYGMTLRPEPLIALCTAGVLVLAELARRRRSLGVLVAATALAAAALTISPSGAVTWAPLVMALAWLIPLLRERGAGQGVAAMCCMVGTASAVVPVAFADASLGQVIDATVTHRWYYPTYSWYQEIFHYNVLLSLDDDGSWGRRAPVVLTLAVLVVVAISAGRHRGAGDPLRRLLLTSAVITTAALVLLGVSPTKWVNHFGAVSAIATVTLTAALLRSPLARRGGPAATGVAVVVVAGAAALVFAGPNLWRPFSDWGQPFGDHRFIGTSAEISTTAPHFGPVYLRNPLLWGALATLLGTGTWWWRRRGRHTALTTDRGLLLIATGVTVALMLAVFVAAPIRQYPGWTVALANLRTASGQPCGLGDQVQVLAVTGTQPTGHGPTLTSGDFALAAGSPAPLSPPAPGLPVWHDAVPAQQANLAHERGALTTPWFPLPADSAATHVSVPVATSTVSRQQVQVQFGTGDLATPVPVQTVTPDLDTQPGKHTWQEIPVQLPTELPATAVRVLVRDTITGPDSWVAVAAPTLSSWQSVHAITAGQPVFADQLSAALWPCVDQIAIRHGLVAPPTVQLLAHDDIRAAVLNNSLASWGGGSLVTVRHTATYVTMASRLHPSGPATRTWGRVQRVVYDHPFGLVDLRVATSTQPGWHRKPTIAGGAYSGPNLG